MTFMQEAEPPPGIFTLIRAHIAAIVHPMPKKPTPAGELDAFFDGDCIKAPEEQGGLHIVPPSQQDSAHALPPEAEEKLNE